MVADETLRSELIARRDADQQARAHAPGGRWTEEERRKCRDVDTANTAWLAALLDTRGWPGRSLVGDGGAHAAWLLAQHADAEPDRQRDFLVAMRKAAAAGEAVHADLAYLEDRCRVNAGEPQIYGTQITTGDDGELIPASLEDPEHVDARRATVCLGPIADYLQQIRALNR